MNLFVKQGNIQFLGNVKIQNNIFTNSQFFQLLSKNIQWKPFLTYKKGQICSKTNIYNDDIYCNFYYSLQDNNKNNDPNNGQSYSKWKIVRLNNEFSKNLAFKIPEIQNNDLIFNIQFSSTVDFKNIYRLSSINCLDYMSSSQSDSSDSSYSSYFEQHSYLFYISTQNCFVPLSKQYFTNIDSNKILLLNLDKISSQYKYFRYYWNNGIEDSKYFFGSCNSSSYFDVPSNCNVNVKVDNENLNGNGTQLYPLTLKNNLTNIYSIESDSGLLLQTVNSNINLNANSGANIINITACDISLNNNYLNTANGLVKLNQNGKIPSQLYIDSDFSERLLPIKKQVDSSYYGNPLVIYKEGQNYQVVGNDNNTLLLIQGSILSNQSLGGKSNLIYQTNQLKVDDNQFFNGGYFIKQLLGNNQLSSCFQFDIQVLYQDLTNGYKSIFQHFNQNDKLCVLKINSKKIFYGQYDSNNQFQYTQKQILKFTLQYIYNSESSYTIKLYQQNTLIFEYQTQYNPFNLQNDIYVYFTKTVSDFSRNNNLLGYSGRWRLLRFSSQIKNDYIKSIGQLYDDQASVNYNSLKTGYKWETSTNTSESVLFGKIGNKPVILPYPQKINYQLPTATNDIKGGIIVGNGLLIDQNGILSVSVDDSNKLDLQNYIQQNGNISIRSQKSIISSVTIQSGYIENFDIGGLLYLGNNQNKYINLCWNNKNNGLYIDDYVVRLINSENLSDYSDSSSSYTGIDIYKDSHININIYNKDLRLNGNKLNTANGLVKLNQNGLIPRFLLQSDDTYLNNSVNIYNTSNEITQVNGIKAGNRINITYENNIATINADQSGQFRDDLIVLKSDLNNGIYIVNDVNIGGFAVQDYNGYLVMPVQRQVNNNVYVDFNNWDFENGSYKIRFIRGVKGNNGQMTQDQTLSLIMSLCF